MEYQANNQPAQQMKKSYCAPVLVEVGDLDQITLAAAPVNLAVDGASTL